MKKLSGEKKTGASQTNYYFDMLETNTNNNSSAVIDDDGNDYV
jgi:hypothetical protein